MMLNKTKAFLVLCLFESCSSSPSAPGREKRFSFIKTCGSKGFYFILFISILFIDLKRMVEDGRAVLHLKLVCPDFAPSEP